MLSDPFRRTCAFLFLSSAGVAIAQTVPTDREDLEASAGAGMAAYADMNGYPGPRHILQMHGQLGLSEDQLKHVEALYEEMAVLARAKGNEIIRQEENLNSMFSTGTPAEDDVVRLSRTIGALRGELRAIHLITHLRAATVLNPEQIALYNKHRSGMRGGHQQKSHGK